MTSAQCSQQPASINEQRQRQFRKETDKALPRYREPHVTRSHELAFPEAARLHRRRRDILLGDNLQTGGFLWMRYSTGRPGISLRISLKFRH